MPYRPHLVSSTTRPVVRPLVQKVFGDFDPLRLDPYLFFDAATSMVGTLENPTLKVMQLLMITILKVDHLLFVLFLEL